MMISNPGSYEAYNYIETVKEKCNMFSFQFLFDDWCNIEKIFEDPEVHVMSFNVTYPRGWRDKRNLHEIIPLTDDRCLRYPTVRISCLTRNGILANNMQRHIGISYDSGNHPVVFDYEMYLIAKSYDYSEIDFLDILKYQLVRRFSLIDKDMANDINNDDFWQNAKAMYPEYLNKRYANNTILSKIREI